MERLLRKLGRCSGSQVKSNHINQKQADFSACFFVSKIRLGGNNLENIENKDRVSAPRHYDAAQPAAHHGICRDRYGQGHYDHDQSSVLVHAHTGQRHTVQLPPAGGGRAAALLPRQRTRLPQRYAVILRFFYLYLGYQCRRRCRSQNRCCQQRPWRDGRRDARQCQVAHDLHQRQQGIQYRAALYGCADLYLGPSKL